MTLFDAGAQPERTELAWRRTALSIGAGSLVALRLLPASLGDSWWALAGLGGLAVVAVVWVWSRRRSEKMNEILLRQGDRARLPDAAILGVLAVAVFAAAAGGVIVIAIHHIAEVGGQLPPR